MTLVWHEQGNGKWRAPAASFRDGRRWIEIAGEYGIEQLEGSSVTDYAEAGRRFSIAYRTETGSTMLGIRHTLGAAHKLAEDHYGRLCTTRGKHPRDIVYMIGKTEHRMRWFDLPVFHAWDRRHHLSISHLWWRETDGNRHLPSDRLLAQLPQLLAEARRETARDKYEIGADTARARTFLGKAQPPPCEQCLRPSPCRARCLRSMLRPDDLRLKKQEGEQ
jgi:hypothetical protein